MIKSALHEFQTENIYVHTVEKKTHCVYILCILMFKTEKKDNFLSLSKKIKPISVLKVVKARVAQGARSRL